MRITISGGIQNCGHSAMLLDDLAGVGFERRASAPSTGRLRPSFLRPRLLKFHYLASSLSDSQRCSAKGIVSEGENLNLGPYSLANLEDDDMKLSAHSTPL